MARGRVVWKTWPPKFKLTLWDMAKRVVYRQCSHAFNGFNSYFTIYWIPTGRRPKFTDDYMKTFTISSENMRVKREVYKGCSLPRYSVRDFITRRY